eukprot:scaffold98853_cov39-Phaeocystis_antarctica.AAC.1
MEHGATMLLEELTREDFGKDVRRVVACRHVAYANLSGAALLSHLEQLTVDVPRVLRGSETVAEIVRPFAIGTHVYRLVHLVAQRL